MGFNDIQFGTTDADTELLRTPEIFDLAFFDPNNIVKELVEGDKFIISGRKGDGKSAFLAKMKRMAEKDNNLETIPNSLEMLNSKSFDRLTDDDLLGGKRYTPMWKCLILIELIKYLEKRNLSNQNERYLKIVDALRRNGYLTGENIESDIKKLDETRITIRLKDWVTYDRFNEKEVIVSGANDIYDKLSEVLKDAYYRDIKFCMVFDGLDDLLRNKDFKPEIITGLLRAANEINNAFRRKTFHFKVIILIRSDIFDLCRDPDITKIKSASSIELSWYVSANQYQSNLANLILFRFNMGEEKIGSFIDIWKKYFPERVDDKDSFQYMLDNTLYKPRDILNFFSIVKVWIGGCDRQLTVDEFQSCLRTYSEEYFFTQMQDELTGFLPDNSINELKQVFSIIGSRRFSYNVFEKELKNHKEFSDIDAETVLRNLFERGYIGQWRKRQDASKEEFFFTAYRNKREVYMKKDDCELHRGLIRAVGV